MEFIKDDQIRFIEFSTENTKSNQILFYKDGKIVLHVSYKQEGRRYFKFENSEDKPIEEIYEKVLAQNFTPISDKQLW